MMRLDRICGQLTEAFRAGNQARKKESAADTIDAVQVTREKMLELFMEQTNLKPGIDPISDEYLVNRGLVMENDEKFTVIPPETHFCYSVIIDSCPNFRWLADDLTFDCDLMLKNLPLKAFPERVHITGYLNIVDCPGIDELPKSLFIKPASSIWIINSPGLLDWVKRQDIRYEFIRSNDYRIYGSEWLKYSGFYDRIG
jgi:hypothetical protein